MSDCQHFEDLLGRMIADELDRDDEIRLEAHLETCGGCRQLALLHDRMKRADFDLEVPDRAELTAARWSVLAQLQKSPRAHRQRFFTAAAAAAVFLFGITLGRALPRSDTPTLLAELESGTSSDESDWILSSVQLSPLANGQVEMQFEVSKPVAVTRTTGDPLIARAVEESLVGASNLGARIRAVDTAGKLAGDPEVRQTLIGAAEFDSSVAVRLQAINLLTDYLDDDRVRDALTRILQDDESAPVRLLALELLGDTELSPDTDFDASAGIEL